MLRELSYMRYFIGEFKGPDKKAVYARIHARSSLEAGMVFLAMRKDLGDIISITDITEAFEPTQKRYPKEEAKTVRRMQKKYEGFHL